MSFFAPKQDEVGTIKDFGMAALPGGWLACDGAPVLRSTFAALFAAIGVVWGAGDGVTTFNVPDCRGRSRIGTGLGAGLTNRALAASGGAEIIVLATPETPIHSHVQDAHGHVQDAHGHVQMAEETNTMLDRNGAISNRNLPTGTSAGGNAISTQGTTATNQATTATNQNAGGGGSHANMEPFRACTVGIRA